MTRPASTLEEAKEELGRGGAVEVTVRTLLGWFGAQRRGWRVIDAIREQMTALGWETSPDFASAYIDEAVILTREGGAEPAQPSEPEPAPELDLEPPPAPAPPSPSSFRPPAPGPGVPRSVPAEGAELALPPLSLEPARVAPSLSGARDPTRDYEQQVRHIPSANRAPVTVQRETALEEAITIMLTRDFSQLPVLAGKREVVGALTWEALAQSQAIGKRALRCVECMTPVRCVPADARLFEVIPAVLSDGFVVVLAKDRVPQGIVTRSDLVERLATLSQPFLLIGELEGFLRELCHGRLLPGDRRYLRGVEGDPFGPPDPASLSLGDYVQLLGVDAVWERLALPFDKHRFRETLDRARVVRNDIMHFSPDPVAPEELAELTSFVRLLRRIRELRA